MDGVVRHTQLNLIEAIGYGYIALPKFVDRDLYIMTALRRQRVTIVPDQGSTYINDCYITKEVAQNIVFPADDTSLGSAVVYVSPMLPNKPIVIGVLTKEDETNLNGEGVFFLEKTFRGTTINITGNAESGALTISVLNSTGAANCLINLAGEQGSTFRVKCQTNINLQCDGDINLETRRNANISSTQVDDSDVRSNIQVNNNNIVMTPNNRFQVGDGEQPVPLGTELTTQLNQNNAYLSTLVTQIATAITASGAPTAGPAASAFTSAMNAVTPGNYANINSDVSFTD